MESYYSVILDTVTSEKEQCSVPYTGHLRQYTGKHDDFKVTHTYLAYQLTIFKEVYGRTVSSPLVWIGTPPSMRRVTKPDPQERNRGLQRRV